MRNAEKRKSRLKKKARQLTDADLDAVLHMRTMTAAEKDAETKKKEDGSEAAEKSK